MQLKLWLKNKIKDPLNRLLGLPTQEESLLSLALLLCLSCLGCVSREEVLVHAWENNFPLPAELCTPELQKYGFYRKLNDGNLEFISACKPEANNYTTFYNPELNTLLDKYLPKEKDAPTN